MLDVYQTLSTEAIARHGDRAVLLLQVGSFWEMYWDVDTVGSANAVEVKELLGLALMKNKPYPAAGFSVDRDSSVDKINRILDAGFTVCLGEQAPADKPGKLRRVITRCFSPGVRLSSADREGTYSCCVYVPKAGDKGVGVAMIDVATGCSIVAEITALADLSHIALSRNVSEVVLIGNLKDEREHRKVRERIDHMWPVKVVVLDRLDGSYEKSTLHDVFVNNVLEETYGTGPVSIDLLLLLSQKQCAKLSLAYLLQFIRLHSLNFGKNLPFPIVVDPGDHVAFSGNALQQLGLPQLLKVINSCVTPMGKRWLRHMLCTPSSDPTYLAERYDAVEAVVRLGKCHVVDVRGGLAKVGDLQKWGRRIVQSDVPLSLASELLDALLAVHDISQRVDDVELTRQVDMFIDKIRPVAQNSSGVLFPDCPVVVDAHAKLVKANEEIERLRAAIHPDARIDMSAADKSPRVFLSKARWKAVPEAEKSKYSITNMTNKVKIWSGELDSASQVAKDADAAFVSAQDAEWLSLIQSIDNASFSHVAERIRDVDVSYACAWNAIRFKHVRPKILENEDSAVFRAKQLGNPVAEAAIAAYSNESYVRNDVTLDDTTQHILLFGMNASGKTVLMKSVALCIIMAQTGMFVPCESLELSPFTRIDTRILTPDDISRGLSSFTAELVEIREALNAASPRSIFLADEMCSTTEWRSATALVGTAICEAHAGGARTFVTTHLHEILDHPEITKALGGSLSVMHMSTRVDPALGVIYERKLTPGPCSPSYGLTVAAAFGFSASFIRRAIDARAVFEGDGLSPATKSRYNKAVAVNKCEICKTRKAVDTHHIKPRHTADSDGMHGPVSEHHVSNLMSLCKACHEKVHHDGKTAVRVKTLRGTEVVWESRPPDMENTIA